MRADPADVAGGEACNSSHQCERFSFCECTQRSRRRKRSGNRKPTPIIVIGLARRHRRAHRNGVVDPAQATYSRWASDNSVNLRDSKQGACDTT
jgi:hypothetical protein